MKEFIKHAYAIERAYKRFNDISKEDILILYTKLDCVYRTLESLDIVSIYSKNEILKDFELFEGMGETKYIRVVGDFKSIEVPIQSIIHELSTVYTEL
jgi:hypothetical protein